MFIPAVGTELTVALPGERLRAEVLRIVDANHVIVFLGGQPMTRGHLFRKGDTIGCRRVQTALEELWEAQDDRAFMANFAPDPEPEITHKPVARQKKPAKPVVKKKAAKPVVKKTTAKGRR
jgi:hypothetical protein